ncbi:MAG: acyltransferase, partial [Bacteroidales bacterium]|nr:acyltransferase [Bacteroidales bacterium]
MKSTNIKQRYELLDGLRGVAALMVIIYHVFECFPMETWIIGHGYLAVDFFFILSGFVIGYAYDDRWGKGGMTFGQFAKRRLIRLHPMVVFGVVIGLVCFLIQGAEGWDGTKATTSAIMISTLLALFLIPNAPGGIGEVRGNGEMFPLNGPHWSLFFEYIGNILYGLLIRRFSTKTLAIWTGILGVFFVRFFLSDPAGYGNIGYGWTLADNGFIAGLLRMLFSYSIGLLLCRVFKP